MARRIWVEQNSEGIWQAHSEDGATLAFGKGSELFSPVELMQIALAGCTALSGQYAVASAMGEDKARGATRVVVSGTFDPETASYIQLQEDVSVDATSAGLDQEAAQALQTRMTKHIARGCTVKHTLENQVPVRVHVSVRN